MQPFDYKEIGSKNGVRMAQVHISDILLWAYEYSWWTKFREQMPITDVRYTLKDPNGGIWVVGPLKECYV